MLNQIKIKTNQRQEVINITGKVKEIVKKSEIEKGICVVYIPHTTAGILINENPDSGVREDIPTVLERLIPSKGEYKHNCIDDNAHAHVKATLIGPNETIIIEQGKLVLGTYQSIALAEFDGPRTRTVYVKIIKE